MINNPYLLMAISLSAPLILWGMARLTVHLIDGKIMYLSDWKKRLENELTWDSYSKMLIIGCYMGGPFTKVSKENKRLVYICDNVDESIKDIQFDWIIWYEPRKNTYTVATMSTILSHPLNRTFRFSCGCERNNGQRDYRGPYGGKNSLCSVGSNETLWEICNCWKNKDKSSYRGHNSKSFLEDLQRIQNWTLDK